jgi:5-methylcytosine-specific restriction endonuclease McrBC regulatory subunit McrC
MASTDEVVKVGKLGVSQSDVYQLFAYSEYFAESQAPSDVVLIYPQDPRVDSEKTEESEGNDITLRALPSVGTIDWEFAPKSREGRKSAKLTIKLFPLPLVDQPKILV